MRVISQDGKLDFPYENSVVFFDTRHYGGNSVVAQLIGDTEAVMLLGKYSTKEKAIKAIEMLRKVYENNVFYHCTAGSKRFEEAQNILSVEQFQKATTEYFQFPQDDEIEV